MWQQEGNPAIWAAQSGVLKDALERGEGVVTERYDRVRLDSLKAAVARLDDGQPFKILSRSDDQPSAVESVSSTH
jgi:hypothetical protein